METENPSNSDETQANTKKDYTVSGKSYVFMIVV